jgi:hypothetical protein
VIGIRNHAVGYLRALVAFLIIGVVVYVVSLIVHHHWLGGSRSRYSHHRTHCEAGGRSPGIRVRAIAGAIVSVPVLGDIDITVIGPTSTGGRSPGFRFPSPQVNAERRPGTLPKRSRLPGE